jgi:anti-sigma28 factor (negative regulator of flagellin synthesis)
MKDKFFSNNSCNKRVRSLTSMTLNWLADRLRKTQSVKKAVVTGEYQISSEKIAKSMLSSSEVTDPKSLH